MRSELSDDPRQVRDAPTTDRQADLRSVARALLSDNPVFCPVHSFRASRYSGASLYRRIVLMFEAITKSTLVVILLSSGPAWAQSGPGPKGMYCGGNQIIQLSRPIRAANVMGTVLDQSGATIPGARIQLQIQGSESLLVDITADENGRFRLPKVQRGAYWLGISTPGFNLHVWDLRIVRFGRTKKLSPKLTVGT